MKHIQFETVKNLTSLSLNVLLVGPAGSGKNHLAEQVAHDLNLPFYPTNKITQEYELTGFIDAQGKYQPRSFYRAFTEGGIFFLDELDASSPEAAVVLNAALANHYFDFPNGRQNAHPNFRVIAGANTLGYGNDEIYTARQAIDQATLDRFEVIQMEYDHRLETYLSSDNLSLYNLIIYTRQAFKECNINKVVTSRSIISINLMIQPQIQEIIDPKTQTHKEITTQTFTMKEAYNIRIINKLEKTEIDRLTKHTLWTDKILPILNDNK